MNKVILIGNLTKDPTFEPAYNLCKFTIAVQRLYVGSDGSKEVDYINISTWNKLAENCNKWLTKGSKVCVEGSLQVNLYEDPDGNKKYFTYVNAQHVEFLNNKPKETEYEVKTVEVKPEDCDDLPF